MADQESPIMNLKLIDLEIDMYIKSYRNASASYDQHIRQGDRVAAAASMKAMDEANNALTTLIAAGSEALNKAVLEGEVDQMVVTESRSILTASTQELNKQVASVKSARARASDLDGDLETSEQFEDMNHFHYIVTLIVAVIMIVLLVNALSSNSSNSLEIAIAIGATAAGLYLFLVPTV
jgi:hypothetical protein